jgi:diphthamide synthase (EF-2-diphthine--ammonia ligase)
MGVAKIAYGDLFLEDILAYRKRLHERIGMAPIFPVWKRNTTAFAHDFIEAGYKAIISCVDAKKLDASFAGRLYDADFLKSLPPEVDPCGENGEFHSFVFDGPLFNEAIRFTPSVPALQRYEDSGHDFQLGFCDLIPIDHVEGGKAGEV